MLVLDWNKRGGAVVLKWKRRGAALDLDWNRRGAALVLEVFSVLRILGQSLTTYYI